MGYLLVQSDRRETNHCGSREYYPSPADVKAHLAIELPDSDAGSTTSSESVAGFMAREVDTSGYGRLPDARVAPGKCDGGGPIGGIGGLALRAWAGEDLQSYYFDSGDSGNSISRLAPIR